MTAQEILTAKILIIGSGPVGLWLAYELRKGSANLDVLVIDSIPGRDKRKKYSKALSISAGALETFESRGVAHFFLESGIPVHKTHFGGFLLGLNTNVLGARYPYNLCIPQTRTEDILLGLCDDVGVRFAWGMEFCALSQNNETVSITARRTTEDGFHKDEDVLIEASWVVGCDGTHSKVRESVGIAFEGTKSTLSGILADMQLSTPPSGPVLMGNNAEARSFLTPIGDGVHHRFTSAMKANTMPPISEVPTLDQIKESLRENFGTDFGAHSPLWFSRFGNACRVAAQFRIGKVFLAGDAAHQLFPAGGQGMNLGFQDATGLAWRLAIVTNGSSLGENATERMLESYSRERHAAAQAVKDNVLAQISLMAAVNPHEVALREVLGEALKNPEINAMWARRVTGFGDPTDAYADLSLEAKSDRIGSLSDSSREDSLIGMRVTNQICGNGMEELFRATTLDKFVLLQTMEEAENVPVSWKPVLKPWTDRVTVLPMAVENRGKNWKNIDALLIRPDMRVAWVAKSDLPITDMQSSFATALDNSFGSS